MRPSTLLSTITIALLTTACSAQDNNVVDTPALQAELAKGDVLLVDVRTLQEWSTGHLTGARHIDWFRDDFRAEMAKLDRNQPVRLYCASGGRSAEARDVLREMGFKDVRDLDGGIQAWKKAGAPIVR